MSNSVGGKNDIAIIKYELLGKYNNIIPSLYSGYWQLRKQITKLSLIKCQFNVCNHYC